MKSFQERGKVSWRAWKVIDVKPMLAIKGGDVNSKRRRQRSWHMLVLFRAADVMVGRSAVVLYEHTYRTVRTTEAFYLTQSTKIRYEREPPRYLKTQSSDFDAIPSTAQP